ncbi:MAG: GIY-YIG nuclease family protein [Polyangiaceae bacterium]
MRRGVFPAARTDAPPSWQLFDGSGSLRLVPPTAQRWFLYLARCADGTIYTGIARDVKARIAAHDAGRGARYTRGRGPLTVCATRRCASQSEALRLEHAVKRLPRAHKERLLNPPRLRVFCRMAERCNSDK